MRFGRLVMRTRVPLRTGRWEAVKLGDGCEAGCRLGTGGTESIARSQELEGTPTRSQSHTVTVGTNV